MMQLTAILGVRVIRGRPRDALDPDWRSARRLTAGVGPFIKDFFIGFGVVLYPLKHMQLKLAKTRFGRVLLHIVCCLQRPGHLRWHWHGIVREFAPAR